MELVRQQRLIAERAAAIEAAKAEAQQRRQEMEEGLNLDINGSTDGSSPSTSLSPDPAERAGSSRLRYHAEMIRKEAQIIRFMREDQNKLPEKVHDVIDVNVLSTWYKLDTNVVPSVYRLQNIR